MRVTPQEAEDIVLYQIGALAGIARSENVQLRHVKPHGALYNMAVRDAALAGAIARAVRAFDPSLLLFAPPGTELARAGEASGLAVAAEGFADRSYEPDGSLTPRSRQGAVIHDTASVVERAVRMAAEGRVTAADGSEILMRVQTICTQVEDAKTLEILRALRINYAQGFGIDRPSPLQ